MRKKQIFGVLPYKRKRYIDKYIVPLFTAYTDYEYKDAWTKFEDKVHKIEKILELISESDLIIVDLSDKNVNVFFEYGFSFASKKSIIPICDKKFFESPDGWNKKLPFDLEGTELVLLDKNNKKKDTIDLRKALLDTLFRTEVTQVNWICPHESARNIVRGSSELELLIDGIVWSDQPISNMFSLSYHVSIQEMHDENNPDIRLVIAPDKNHSPFFCVIYPWQCGGQEAGKRSCIMNAYLDNPSEKAWPNHRNIQVVDIGPAIPNRIEEFDVFFLFKQPNIVFEGTSFSPENSRVFSSVKSLDEYDIELSDGVFIGFRTLNTKTIISNITVKQLIEK